MNAPLVIARRAPAWKRPCATPFVLKDIEAQPWKNGGGITRTVASREASDGSRVDWRVSVAEIADSGPFSVFPGMDRIAVVLDNGPLRLATTVVQGQVAPPAYLAAALAPTAFPGDVELFADVAGAPITCLNVMTRRGHIRANIEVLRGDSTFEVSCPSIAFAVDSTWRLTAARLPVCPDLSPRTGVVLHDRAAVRARPVDGNGHLIVIHFNEHPPFLE